MILAFKKIPSSRKGEIYAQIAKMSSRKCYKCANKDVLGGLEEGLRFFSFGGALKVLIK